MHDTLEKPRINFAFYSLIRIFVANKPYYTIFKPLNTL